MYQEAIFSLSLGHPTQEWWLLSQSRVDHGAGDRGPGGEGGGTVGRMVLMAPTVLEWDLKAACNCDDWTDTMHFNFFQLKQWRPSKVIFKLLFKTFLINKRLGKASLCQPSVLMSDSEAKVTLTQHSSLEPWGCSPMVDPSKATWVPWCYRCLGSCLPSCPEGECFWG